MAPKKRDGIKNEAGKGTTVAKEGGADAIVACKLEAESYAEKEAAKSTQSSDSLDDDKSNETEEQTNQEEDSPHLAAGEKIQSSEDKRQKSGDQGYFFPCLMFFIPTLLVLLVAIVFLSLIHI